jgi:hypothetical protein
VGRYRLSASMLNRQKDDLMKSVSITVTTSPTLMVGADNQNRSIYIHNAGGAKIYIGDSSVSTADGFHLGNGESQEIFLPINQTLYGIVASGSNQVIVLMPDGD